jgi:hypothetical protein
MVSLSRASSGACVTTSSAALSKIGPVWLLFVCQAFIVFERRVRLTTCFLFLSALRGSCTSVYRVGSYGAVFETPRGSNRPRRMTSTTHLRNNDYEAQSKLRRVLDKEDDIPKNVSLEYLEDRLFEITPSRLIGPNIIEQFINSVPQFTYTGLVLVSLLARNWRIVCIHVRFVT